MQFSGKVAKWFVASRLLVIFSAVAASKLIPTYDYSKAWNISAPFFNVFAHWDSGYYLSIAKNGYLFSQNWAFRPLFPLVMGASATSISPFFGADVALTVAGFFVNNALFLLALLMFHKLTTRLFSQSLAESSVLLLAFCPAGIFYSAIYPESLYLLLLVVSFYYLEIQKVYSSGLVGYLAGLTRPEGIFTAIPLLIQAAFANISLKQKKKAIIASLIAVTSLLTMLVLGWLIAENPLVVFSTEIGWDRVTLIQAFLAPSKIFSIGFVEFWLVSISMIILCLAAVIGFFAKNRTNLKPHRLLPYYSYAAVLLVFFLVVGDIKSLARYSCALIPVYWTLALWFEKKPSAKPFIFVLFAVQLVVGAVLFADWYPYV